MWINAYIDFAPWFAEESLRINGSNFIEWDRRLRALLQPNAILYTIEKPLGDSPGNGAALDEVQRFLAHRDHYLLVQMAVVHSVVPELRSHICLRDRYIRYTNVIIFFH